MIQAQYSQRITHNIVSSPLSAAMAFIAIMEWLNAREMYVKTNFHR